jgi:hypothetical protein
LKKIEIKYNNNHPINLFNLIKRIIKLISNLIAYLFANTMLIKIQIKNVYICAKRILSRLGLLSLTIISSKLNNKNNLMKYITQNANSILQKQ